MLVCHNYGLVNEHKKDQALRHHFVLGVAEGDSVVRLPRTPWNGDLTLRPTTHTATFIDLRALGDLTEAGLPAAASSESGALRTTRTG